MFAKYTEREERREGRVTKSIGGLQPIQNAAATVLTGTRKIKHISLVLIALHLLPERADWPLEVSGVFLVGCRQNCNWKSICMCLDQLAHHVVWLLWLDGGRVEPFNITGSGQNGRQWVSHSTSEFNETDEMWRRNTKVVLKSWGGKWSPLRQLQQSGSKVPDFSSGSAATSRATSEDSREDAVSPSTSSNIGEYETDSRQEGNRAESEPSHPPEPNNSRPVATV